MEGFETTAMVKPEIIHMLLNNPRLNSLCRLVPAILLLLSLSSNSAARIETPSNPNSAKACAICHYRWIDTFFVQGTGTDLVPYQSEKVVATAPMC